MNLQQLEYFKTIAEVENFTTASKLLSVTQPALSKSIANLEEELNIPLFEKQGRNIKLTKYGRLFLTHAEIALKELEDGITEIKQLIHPDSGSLTLATTTNIGTHFLPAMISSFLLESPDAKLQFSYEQLDHIPEKLLSGQADFGFFDCAHTLPFGDELACMPVQQVEYVLIVPKNHPLSGQTEISLKELKEESFIASCPATKKQLCSCSSLLGFTPKITVSPNEPFMIESLVAAGAGIAVVSNTPLMNTNTLSVIQIKEHICYRTIYMGWKKDRKHTPITKKFLSYMETSYGNMLQP